MRCRMNAAWKFLENYSMHFVKKAMHFLFLCNIQKKVLAITFNKQYFFESQETFWCLIREHIRKIDDSLIL